VSAAHGPKGERAYSLSELTSSEAGLLTSIKGLMVCRGLPTMYTNFSCLNLVF
jgi:hypothetical protein